MSAELAIPSRTIRYLNVHREGTGDPNDFCSVDSRWTMPIIDKLDQYLVAVTRFEIPANRLPMTQGLKNCIQIFRYPDSFNGNVEAQVGTREEILDHLDAIESIADMNMTLNSIKVVPDEDDEVSIGHEISMMPCHTVYEFIKKLNAQINEALLFNTGTKQFDPSGTNNTPHASPNTEQRNMFTTSTGVIINDTDPIAYVKIKMDADFMFRVEMNSLFAEKYYLKMSKALFNMLGFVEGHSSTKATIRHDLAGYRFMASRVTDAVANDGRRHTYYTRLQSQYPTYTDGQRELNGFIDFDLIFEFTDTKTNHSNVQAQLNRVFYHKSPIATFTAPISCADTINRVKSLLISSSMATVSEGDTGESYRRILTDYTIPVQTGFTFNPQTMVGGGVNENAASEYTYTNTNPSAGRFLTISDPSPLYELKIEALARCFDFETNQFEIVPIPLPIGGTFSIKLVFISRTELHRRDAPDSLKA